MWGYHQDETAVSPYNPTVLISVGIVFTILPAVVVGLRFYSRRSRKLGIQLDDWMILVALIISTATAVVYFASVTMGNLGQHQDLDENGQVIYNKELRVYKKTQYLNQIISGINLGVIKISVLLFYRRIFSVKPFMLASTILIGIITIWTVTFTGILLGQCSPPHLAWTAQPDGTGGSCIDIQPVYQAIAYSDLVLDFAILILPVPSVLVLRISWQKKMTVLDVILLTSIVLGSGIARVITYSNVIEEWEKNPNSFKFDATWCAAGPLFWNFIENTVAIIGACIPSLAPLWRRARNNTGDANSASCTSTRATGTGVTTTRGGGSIYYYPSKSPSAFNTHSLPEKSIAQSSITADSQSSRRGSVNSRTESVPSVPDLPSLSPPQMANVLSGQEPTGGPLTMIFAAEPQRTTSPPPMTGIQVKKSFDTSNMPV